MKTNVLKIGRYGALAGAAVLVLGLAACSRSLPPPTVAAASAEPAPAAKALEQPTSIIVHADKALRPGTRYATESRLSMDLTVVLAAGTRAKSLVVQGDEHVATHTEVLASGGTSKARWRVTYDDWKKRTTVDGQPADNDTSLTGLSFIVDGTGSMPHVTDDAGRDVREDIARKVLGDQVSTSSGQKLFPARSIRVGDAIEEYGKAAAQRLGGKDDGAEVHAKLAAIRDVGGQRFAVVDVACQFTTRSKGGLFGDSDLRFSLEGTSVVRGADGAEVETHLQGPTTLEGAMYVKGKAVRLSGEGHLRMDSRNTYDGSAVSP